jgi:hypothetical protein
MGVNLWGASPLYVDPTNMGSILVKVLAKGKGGTARNCLKEAGVHRYEPPTAAFWRDSKHQGLLSVKELWVNIDYSRFSGIGCEDPAH